ncbi:hypothetical protein JYK00_08090 [Thermosipho ferrireducens]|uniref:Uncharacterized protein n=1 Tax=Thermosipho ferrireducens TaxID=2571116 RepID=A0ABX7S588_9BACT|nr:hypothetical protein [Thermosipho ferrireducens]QTA37677.1 hypothetical protein JYK00_08090 [Thermosipho ferrireducens]
MSDFKKIKEILEKIARKYNCKIWICEKIGKRISFIEGLKAGKEFFMPPQIVYEDNEIIIFTENLTETNDEFHTLLKEVIYLVHNR